MGWAGRRVLVVLATCMAMGSAWPAGAGGGWFAAEPVDAGVAAVGGMDLARDGTGAFAYVKPDAGVPHVFLSRMRDGAQQPPERVDADVAEAGSGPVGGAPPGGRLVRGRAGGGAP